MPTHATEHDRAHDRFLRSAMLASILWTVQLCPQAFGDDLSTLPLSSLEKRLDDSFRVKAADAQLEYARQALHQEQSKAGAQIQAGVAVGRHRQIVTDELTRTYSALAPQLSLSFPLLGSRAKQLDSIQEAQTQVKVDTIDLEETRRLLLHELRKGYIAYWQYRRQGQLARRYGEVLAEKTKAAVKLREAGIWADGDYLNFNATLAGARQEQAKMAAMAAEALEAMGVIVRQVSAAFEPSTPDLPVPCLMGARLGPSAERHSAVLNKLDARFEALVFSRDINAGSSVNSDLHIGVGYVDDYSSNRRGYSAVAGVSVSMPAGFQEADRANRDRLNAAMLANRSLREQNLRELRAAVRNGLENYRLAQSALGAAQEQSKAARESLRSARLQFEQAAQPIFDQLIRAIAAEYQASTTEIDTEAGLFHRANDLLLLAPDSCEAGGAG